MHGFRSIILLYLYMDATGIGTMDAYIPKSKTDFWIKKFTRNIERDEEVMTKLKEQGVKALIIWECTIKQMMKSLEFEKSVLLKVEQFFCSKELFLEI